MRFSISFSYVLNSLCLDPGYDVLLPALPVIILFFVAAEAGRVDRPAAVGLGQVQLTIADVNHGAVVMIVAVGLISSHNY